MNYAIDITYSNEFPFIGIKDENNHRTLLSPNDECSIEDEEVQNIIKTTFTTKVKKAYKKYTDSLKPSVEQEEIDRKQSIKNKANAIILEQYPYWKQLNIIRLGGKDLEEMNLFIMTVQTISNQAEEDGLWSNQVDWTI